MKTVFLRALEELVDKEAALRFAIQHPGAALGQQRFEVDPESFAAVPRSPFAYWVSERMRRLFKELPPVEADGRVARVTNPAGDDNRYFRAWWEPKASARNDVLAWIPLSKGGSLAHFYFDVHLLVRWDRRVRSYAGFLGTEHRPLTKPASLEYFFRPGLTWPRRTKSELSFRALPGGCIFADKGPGIFVDSDDPETLLAILAIGSTKAFRSLVEFQLAAADAKRGGAAHSYEVGVIQRTPIPRIGKSDAVLLSGLARSAWSLKRTLDVPNEVSHAYALPVVLLVSGNTLISRASAWDEHIQKIDTELAAVISRIEAKSFELYDIDESDRRAITVGFTASASVSEGNEVIQSVEGDTDDDADEDGDVGRKCDAATLAAGLMSWAIGVAFGRFDIRLATGARSVPLEPSPFEPLPICSPAMLTDGGGLPHTKPPAGYPLTVHENGILVDDRGYTRDVTAAVRTVFDEVFKARADEWWSEVGALLDPQNHELSKWIASKFFDYHLKVYSKSRRRAPMFWQLAVPSVRYSVWLYAQYLTRDSLFQVQTEILEPKLAHEERQLVALIEDGGPSPSAKERKEIAEQESLVEELRAFLDEVKRVAPLWNPVLDDGVVLTMAPLWRLVPHQKAWQKELKSKWDELTAGKYDWSHVAMHFWPERVVWKCSTDRSIAIAHELEDVFWSEGDDGGWQRRLSPTRPIDQLIRERSSIAVQSALKELTEASSPNGPKARARRSSS